MKKYKLIKEYPGSPKLGTIISQLGTSQFYEDKNNSAIMKQCFDYKIFSKYPEYWEEVVEKDYEILSFIRNSSSAKGDIKIKGSDGRFRWNLTCASDTEEDLLQRNGFDIHSVKRLSDGEIFTVCDEINYEVINTNKNRIITTKINKFYIDLNNKLRINFNLDREGINTNSYLENLIKFKNPLFTTEDGVDIFKGESYYTVYLENTEFRNKFDLMGPHIARTKLEEKPKRVVDVFSTKEAAEDYILMNKPCLSINDINNSWEFTKNRKGKFVHGSGTLKNLKKLVKSKL